MVFGVAHGQMDPTSLPQQWEPTLPCVGAGRGCLSRHPTGGGEVWDTKGWIQLTRFDQLNSFTSQRTVAFAGLYGECQLVTEPSPAGISKCKGDAPANANPKISWIMKESTSIRTSRESHKNLAPYNHQLQKTKNGSRSIKSPAHTHWTSR